MALTQLHSIYHIDKYRYTICAIFLVIMLDSMCIHAYILAAMAGSIFTAICICAITSTSCTLWDHYIYIMCMHGTSTAAHFTWFWGSHVGPSDTHSHSLYLTFLLCAPSGPLPLDFFLLYITTSGGMFFMAYSRLKAVYPESLRSYLTANLPSLKASEKIHSLFSPLLVVGFQLHREFFISLFYYSQKNT